MEFITSYRFKVPQRGKQAWQRYGVALCAVLVGAMARYGLGQFFSQLGSAPFILFYPAVLFAAWYGGFGPGLFATGAAALAAEYFFIPPPLQFLKWTAGVWIQLGLFVFVNLLMIYMADNLRRVLVANNESGMQLLASRKKVFEILQSIQGCFFTVDRGENFVHINEGCRDYIRDTTRHLGKSIWSAFPAWEKNYFGQKFQEAAALRRVLQFEFHDTADGRWHEVHMSPSPEGISVHIFDITARKNVETRLSRLVASDIIGVVFGTFPDKVITQANDIFLKMLGYSREELLGKVTETALTPPEYHALDAEKWEECRRTGTCEPWEKEYLRRDGSRAPVLLRVTALDELGKEWGCFIGDLTENKTRQKRQLTEYAITQILAIDPTLSIAMPKILQTICEGLGWELGIFWERALGSSFLLFNDFWTSDLGRDSSFVDASAGMNFPIGRPLPGDIWQTGAPRWVYDIGMADNFQRKDLALQQGFKSAFGFPVRLGKQVLGVLEFFSFQTQQPDQGLLDMVGAIGSEIGQFIERKQAETELRLSQQHFNLALEAARMGYWSWDLKTEKIEWSENLRFFHGREPSEFVGTFEAFLSSVHPDDRDWVGQKLLEAVRSRSEYQLEFRVLWPDQSLHWIDVRGQVFLDEDGDALRMIGLLIDITDQKRAEEHLRQVNEDLERRVEKRTFDLARANLDLKNEILERRKVEREALEIVQKEQRRFSSQLHDGLCQNLTGTMMMAKALTRKLEKKSLPEAGELRAITDLINRSVDEARDMARGLFPVELETNSLMFSLHGLSVRTEGLFQVNCRFHCPEPILLKNHLTATHLFRIAQEAVQNAVSHGHAKNVEIGLRRREEGGIVLEVQDDGTGLSEDVSVPVGIGLQIMKYRARMMDASLGFEKLNHGTLFTCAVPSAEE